MGSGLCGAQTASALPTWPTDGIGPRTVAGVCRGPLKAHGAWTDSRSTVGFKAFLFYFEFSLGGGPKQNTSTQNTSTVNRLSKLSPPSSRLGTDCFTSKLTRMSNVRVSFRIRPKNMRLTSHCRAESRAAQARLATLFAFHGAVQIIARSSPTHFLERRLVRFLRLHRATLCCADFRV